MEKYCPKCNKENAPEALFCRNCASTLAVGQGGIYAPPNQQQQQNQPPFANQQQNQPPFANQQWNQGAAGIPGAGNYARPSAGPSGRAIGSLILTICGLVLCCGGFTAIPGAILGWLEISAIREGRSSQQGLMMAQIGLWGGIIITILTAIGYVFILPVLMLGSM
jgi:hypothetical protein